MCTRNGSVELDTNAFIFNVNALFCFWYTSFQFSNQNHIICLVKVDIFWVVEVLKSPFFAYVSLSII